jgi:RNA polymerase sigma factor (TIGR02999 family)
MPDVALILSRIESGDPAAADQQLPLVYDELRRSAANRLAHEKRGQTLRATALVHEAYLRLVEGSRAQQWNSRGHFVAAAAEAIRRILVENARHKMRDKHGEIVGEFERSVKQHPPISMCTPDPYRPDATPRCRRNGTRMTRAWH